MTWVWILYNYTPAQRSWRGRGILDSPCPSVRPSVRLSVRPSVCRRHGSRSINQVCFGISVSNFMCMSFVAVGCSLMIFSYVAFKMSALWFWTMFNCNPPIAHCCPLLRGGGILVDHWSTISISSRGGCKELYSHLYSLGFQLRYVPLLDHHKRFAEIRAHFQ